MGITEKKQQLVRELLEKQPEMTQAEVQKHVVKKFGNKIAKTPLSQVWQETHKGKQRRGRPPKAKPVETKAIGQRKAVTRISDVPPPSVRVEAMQLLKLLQQLKPLGITAVIFSDGGRLDL